MFTGLVEARGTLVRRALHGSDARLTVQGDFGIAPGGSSVGREALVLGESIAVDGVCLTVDKIVEPGGPGPSVFEVDASAETLARTTLGQLTQRAAVNLERAVPLGGRMGGHIVSGHVDGVGRVADKTPLGGAVRVAFEAPRELLRFIAPKGSITVSGVSLTVNGVSESRFDVVLVPHTRERTSLDALPVSAPVNLEVDVLARYVARLLEAGRESDAASSDAAWLERLKRAGYI